MKKIMFDNKFGLTDAVMKGSKTMTRRTVHEKYLRIYEDMSRLGQPCYPLEEWLIRKAAAYKVGKVVAVAQSYKDLGYRKEQVEQHILPNPKANQNDPFEKKYPGWNNKMFVRADLMPHQIRITDIKVERLQDISDEDCMREGIVRHTPFPIDKNNPRYAYNVNKQGLAFKWFGTPKNAFADLIDKVSGKGTWERDPYVFAYTFELVK